MTSAAPSVSALSASRLPEVVRLEHIRTAGIGVSGSSRIRRSASRPSISGISISSVTTCGRSSATFATASLPSRAVPTTSMPGSSLSMFAIARRMNAESSTTKTLRTSGCDISAALPSRPASGSIKKRQLASCIGDNISPAESGSGLPHRTKQHTPTSVGESIQNNHNWMSTPPLPPRRILSRRHQKQRGPPKRASVPSSKCPGEDSNLHGIAPTTTSR